MEKCSSSSGVSSGLVIACISKSSSSSSSSKKQKHKKVPQRGLGVAQLEKIRLEEQQSNNPHAGVGVGVGVVSPSSSVTTVISTPPPSSSSCPSSSCLDMSHIPSLPFSPPMTSAVFRPPHSTSVDAIWQGGLGLAGHQFGVGKESFPVVDHGMAYRNKITGLVQRPQQPCSSLVNVSPTTLTSSVLNTQMEPPSNQSFGSNYTPLWTAEEEKMVCLKRPYPFSLDDPPGLTINYKIPTLIHPGCRSDVSAYSGNLGTNNRGPSNHIIREGPLCPIWSKSNSKQRIEDSGDLLTLAPPATSILFPNTYFKHPPDRLPLYNGNLPDIEPPPFQGAIEDLYPQPLRSGSSQPQTYHSFLPPPQGQSCQKPTTTNKHNGTEEGGGLDLDLKL